MTTKPAKAEVAAEVPSPRIVVLTGMKIETPSDRPGPKGKGKVKKAAKGAT